MVQAAGNISSRYQCAVLVKGGHQLNDANDLLCRDEHCRWFYGKRIDNPNTHGTGCTLSSAIAANLAKGFDMEESVIFVLFQPEALCITNIRTICLCSDNVLFFAVT